MLPYHMANMLHIICLIFMKPVGVLRNSSSVRWKQAVDSCSGSEHVRRLVSILSLNSTFSLA